MNHDLYMVAAWDFLVAAWQDTSTSDGLICRRQGVATRRRWRRCFGATTRVKIRAERPSSRGKNPARGPNFSDWQVKFGKLLGIDLFFLWQNIWGVAKLQDLGNKKSQTVGVALSLYVKHV